MNTKTILIVGAAAIVVYYLWKRSVNNAAVSQIPGIVEGVGSALLTNIETIGQP